MSLRSLKSSILSNQFALTLAMKFVAVAVLVAVVLAAGCSPSGGKDGAAGKEVKNIKVGVCAGPYEDMFRDAIEPALVEKGYKVNYVRFSDYVQPNKALAEGAVNVNIFQHSVYLRNFAAEHGLDLVHVTEIPTAGMGIFSSGVKSINNVPRGAKVAIPNDVTNLA